MKILFAVDLREPVFVTQTVADMAARLEAELFVLHVMLAAPSPSMMPIDPLTGFGDFSSYTLYDPELEWEFEQAEERAFEQFLSERFHLPVQARLREGDPAAVILEEAEALHVNLIVLGKRHHSALERLLLGDVIKEVTEHTSRPVLLMPIPEEAE